jgi:heptosyltransferase-2
MINFHCRHYKGSKPCTFNKTEGMECPTCTRADEFRCRVLIVKLDALGDVLRTGSLVPILHRLHPRPYVCWITRPEAVEIVRMIDGVDEVVPLNVDGLARIAEGGWDHVYALSNDHSTASLATAARAANPPVGYSMKDGRLHPSNAAAERWLEMAAFDRRANTESYQKLMLDIVGVEGSIEPPRLTVERKHLDHAAGWIAGLFAGSGRRRIAINVGSGARWPKKMLEVDQIAAYARLARERLDADILLVGGPAEIGKTEAILAACGPGTPVRSALTSHSVPEFVGVLRQVDALLCGDTLALHIATAIGLPTVCLVGPTSSAELADFDGLVLKSSVDTLDCLGCYGDCRKVDNCMSLFDMGALVDLTARQLARPVPARPAGA